MQRETCQLEKDKKMSKNFFEALAKRFRLLSKLTRRFKEQKSSSFPTFCQMVFTKA